jgi:hypothetical protein
MKRVSTLLNISEAFEYTSGEGCVYPHGEESYYVNSNVNCHYEVWCNNGMFYCEQCDEDIPKTYHFHSETVNLLYEKEFNKRAIENGYSLDDEDNEIEEELY